MRLGILGGTFDPIHLGHLLIAEAAYDALGLDRVLFVPAGNPPHKQDVRKTAARHRQTIVELGIAGAAHFHLSRIDLDRPGPHYSVDTVQRIRDHYNVSAENCFFIIGGDSLADLPEWHQPQALIDSCRLAVIHRPGYQPDTTDLARIIHGLKERLSWIASPTIALSSSQVRERVAAGQSIRYQVPEAVRLYIEHHHLYSAKVSSQ